GVPNIWPFWDSASWDGSRWRVAVHCADSSGWVTGLDTLWVTWRNLGTDSLLRVDTLPSCASAEGIKGEESFSPWLEVHVWVTGDGYPLDNSFSRVLFPLGEPPLKIREISPCPGEGEPEWLEFENTGLDFLRLSRLGLCVPMSEMEDSTEKLAPQQVALVTDDPEALLIWAPGLAQQPILQTKKALGLANSGDTVRLCVDGFVVDSAFWGALSGQACPGTFRVDGDTLQMLSSATPGWTVSGEVEDSLPLLASRFVSMENPLRLHLPGSDSSWIVQLWRRDGIALLTQNKVAAGLFLWTPPASVPSGPCLLQVLHEGATPWRRSLVLGD
ncbi:MAG TPA: hypothetical protein VLM37_11600, partial [Fibrobacteraceae bacterium]|nr:hypothetical protein [Fibrobacteraceae bacterium]